MDQVRHLNPAIGYSMITLDTRWDPKAKRIYNPKAETQSLWLKSIRKSSQSNKWMRAWRKKSGVERRSLVRPLLVLPFGYLNAA
ncbi:hypothetical protein PIB30_094175 [Stylosanthes scabra]|uniref:Uncharacterized protein n=1 Tax=Stylosanthes scabra TaxID=79078 RepID=A0ABU6ZTZ6_9FABA|nr:hypothetical protein [Stylosanthes scabra]